VGPGGNGIPAKSKERDQLWKILYNRLRYHYKPPMSFGDNSAFGFVLLLIMVLLGLALASSFSPGSRERRRRRRNYGRVVSNVRRPMVRLNAKTR
jgi:hypothetical protein